MIDERVQIKFEEHEFADESVRTTVESTFENREARVYLSSIGVTQHRILITL
jgi:hypothetical protein